MASEGMGIEQDVTLRMPETPGKRTVLVAASELAALRAWQEKTIPLLALLAYGGNEGQWAQTQARTLLAESEGTNG